MVKYFLQIGKAISFSSYNLVKAAVTKFDVRNVITVSNLTKLIFIYTSSIMWVMVFEIDYSDNFWQKAINNQFSSKKISFYSVRDRIGEELMYDRLIQVAKKENYDFVAVKFTEELQSFWFTRHLYYTAVSIANLILKPDFNLALTHHVNILPWGYNISYLNMPLDSLYNKIGEFKEAWKHLNDYDAYADLYSLSNGSNEVLAVVIKNSKKAKPIYPLYIGLAAGDYSFSEPRKALLTGSLWGCNRGSLRIARALKKLASEDLIVAVGLKDHLDFLGKAYLGRLEAFGSALRALAEFERKYGISLIIHNHEHMLDGIPTSRLSEAISSGALIISDRNGFLSKYFGDNALYFDAFAPTQEIYQQIKNHILWARKNPELVAQKTKQAHQIFIDNFTIEQQLNSLFEAVKADS